MIPQSRRVPGGPSLLPLMFLRLILICASTQAGQEPAPAPSSDKHRLFARDNLIAWCIVPFDSKKRSPEERAAMLERLGFRHFAYDWRAEHIPTFDAEIDALKRHGVSLDAFWVAPGELNRESRIILDVLKRHGDQGRALGPARPGRRSRDGRRAGESGRGRGSEAPPAGRGGRQDRLLAGALQPRRLVRRAREPARHHRAAEASRASTNVGIVYNLHHGHDHLDRFAEVLAKIKPYLVAINLNGMDPGGDRVGRKILPLGQGSLRPGAVADHPRQRLSRADRHPRPHRWTTPRSGCATTSTASTGCCPSSTASRPARARSRGRPCPRRRQLHREPAPRRPPDGRAGRRP